MRAIETIILVFVSENESLHTKLPLVNWILKMTSKPRVCAVSYLNTVPLVWGMLHGDERNLFDLSFGLPAECADRLSDGRADIGIVPAVELTRQKLDIIPGAGIACRGPVRSILLISKVPFERIQILAGDSSSRTSVALARIILQRKYGAEPELIAHAPKLNSMLQQAEAALIIGDPALAIEPDALPYATLDLGAEWVKMTGLPMVFAVWAARASGYDANPFLSSLRFGLDHLEQIVNQEASKRGFPPDLARRYLTEHIAFDLGAREYEGLDLFLDYARQLPNPILSGRLTVS
jgi:chorismate dehydratase